jgi:hypothetical protein
MYTHTHIYIYTYIQTYKKNIHTFAYTSTCQRVDVTATGNLPPKAARTLSGAMVKASRTPYIHFMVTRMVKVSQTPYTAIPIIIEGPFQVFQRFSGSKLVLKTVESCSMALNYYH